jgi:hypothetical protein
VVMGEATRGDVNSRSEDKAAATAVKSEHGDQNGNDNKEESAAAEDAAGKEEKNNTNNENKKTKAEDDSAGGPPPPLLKGTLTANVVERKHVLKGMWNYDYTNTPASQMPEKPSPAQQFELTRVFPQEASEAEIQEVPSNGTFNGNFSLYYYAQTKNGKTRERSKLVPETGVAITFERVPAGSDVSAQHEFKVTGRGRNEFGEFDVYGTAKRSDDAHDTLDVELRKKYVTPSAPPEKKKRDDGDSTSGGPLAKKQKLMGGGRSLASTENHELPDPSPTFPTGVVCMRGRIFRVKGSELGVQENIHRIRGQWSGGLDLILADPKNERGTTNEFLYEHKSIAEKCDNFPLTGRYTGWFDLTGEGNSKSRISEKDVSLKFKPNNADGYNVEGKGSNVFGRYSITGTLEADPEAEVSTDGAAPTSWLITVFKHFQIRKPKKQKKNINPNNIAAAAATTAVAAVVAPRPPAATVATAPTATNGAMEVDPAKPLYTLDDVVIPGMAGFKPTEESQTFVPPVNATPKAGTYTALSRGVLRIDQDGAHTCGGKWAISREHFTSNITSNFHFGIDAQLAVETTKSILSKEGRLPPSADTLLPGDLPRVFPINSANYKGSFKMKRGATKYSSVVDNQVAIKFIKNDVGGYNVHGIGHNNIGRFNLIGTLVPQGETTGVMELYRIYMEAPKVPEKFAVKPSPPVAAGMNGSHAPDATAVGLQTPSSLGFQRTESGRPVKLPPRLEESDPKARLARLMDKCGQILATLVEQDRMKGKFFGEAVDPVSLGIPNYHEIITNPMDLGTIQRKLAAGDIATPEEFAKLVRLVFENAMRFNVDPTHSVHISALNLLVTFNRKFGDVERLASAGSAPRRLSKAELKVKQREEKRKQKEALKDEKRKKQKEEKLIKKRQKGDSDEQLSGLPAPHDLPGGGDAPEGYIAKSEFDKLQAQMVQMQQMLSSFQQQLTSLGARVWVGPAAADPAASYLPPAALPPSVLESVPADRSSSASTDKKLSKASSKSKKAKASPAHAAPVEEEDVEEGEVEEEEKPLTIEEQEKMTEIINELGGEHLNEVIKIIREGTKLGDEDEIDLEIDLLPISTQRKLQNFVLKVRCLMLCELVASSEHSLYCYA